MNKLYGIILAMVALLVLSAGMAIGVTYPINGTMLQQNATNDTQGPIETIGTIEPIITPIITTAEPTNTVIETVEKTVKPTETESKIPKETQKSPGFDMILVIGALSMIYIFRQRR